MVIRFFKNFFDFNFAVISNIVKVAKTVFQRTPFVPFTRFHQMCTFGPSVLFSLYCMCIHTRLPRTGRLAVADTASCTFISNALRTFGESVLLPDTVQVMSGVRPSQSSDAVSVS